jgi:sodium-dependent dicarboxylate transporter 2/3/5
VGRDIAFFELSYYMFPIGWLMTFILWGFFMVFFKPERKTIPGLREKAKQLNSESGPFTRQEIMTGVIVFGCILIMSLRSFIPALQPINKTALILISTILFFLLGILDIDDLEMVPWNIILLFAGAMSIGFCLWDTGAAKWLAVNWLVMFQKANWFIFVMSIAFFVMMMTNFIMNVAAIAISLPVALVIAPYLGVSPEVILFASLTVAGMPFLLLVGAAPNAIAYNSKQFTPGEFFLYGIPASIILMVVVGFAVFIIWPMMGMPQLSVISFLKKRFNAKYVDVVTEPGPNLILAKRTDQKLVESIFNRVDLSVHKHHSKGIAVVGHYDCAGNPAEKEEQFLHLRDAIILLRSRYPEVEIIGLWVDDQWQTKEIMGSGTKI